MKKVLLCASALLLALSLVACVEGNNPPSTSDAPLSSDLPPVTTTAEPIVTTTAEPVVTTAEPVETTTAEPVVTTAAPAVTTEPPVTSVSIDYIPIPTEPPVTTAVPVTTVPAETTTVPAETTEPPYTGEFDLARSDLSEYILLGKYLGIEVYVTEPAPVETEAVEAKVDAALETLPDEAMVRDRAAAEGDKVNIDFTGKLDGEPFDGGSAAGQTLTLGSSAFIDGFEEGVVGMMPGETKTLELTFPEDYYPDLAGLAVSFEITLNYIYPTLTDAVAATYLGAADAASYRAGILAELEAARQNEFAAAKEEAAWTKALANSRVAAYPEVLLSEAFESSVSVYVSLAEMYGMTYADLFPTVYGLPVEEAESILMESSKNIVAQRLLLYAIARDMGIDVSDERFEEDLAATAAILGVESVDELVAQLGRDKASLKEDKLYSQVITEIVAQANFVVQQAE